MLPLAECRRSSLANLVNGHDSTTWLTRVMSELMSLHVAAGSPTLSQQMQLAWLDLWRCDQD